MIYRVWNLTGEEIEINAYNRNGVSKQLFDHFSMLVNITRFVRIGDTIEMDYRLNDSLDIKTKTFHIMSPKLGYTDEGMVHVLK